MHSEAQMERLRWPQPRPPHEAASIELTLRHKMAAQLIATPLALPGQPNAQVGGKGQKVYQAWQNTKIL